jgi:hypothetical protein
MTGIDVAPTSRDRQRKEARQAQVMGELERLSAEFKDWLAQMDVLNRNEEGQYVGQHASQLAAIDLTLNGALKTLRDNLANLPLTGDVAAVYDDCRAYDIAIVWVRRLWSFFRSKLDQRLDRDRLGPLLRAADEVVWSTYRQVFVQAGFSRQGTPPLPFIEPAYAPGAIVAGRLPGQLNLFTDLPFMDPFLKKLPMPVLQLPPWCVDAPWWLVYIGHEVGHFVQKDLDLMTTFEEGVAKAAKKGGAVSKDDKLWRAWSREIFADLFFLVVMGPWALYAIVEAEWGRPEFMLTRKDEYPSPVVRLALMDKAGSLLGLDTAAALRGIDPAALTAGDAEAERDRQAATEVVKFGLGKLSADLGTLADLGDFRAEVFGEAGSVAIWRGKLRAINDIAVSRNLNTARELACGSLSAWSELVDNPPPGVDRKSEGERLASRTKKALRDSAAPGTRALAVAGPKPLVSAGAEMGALLLQYARSGAGRQGR